MAIKKAKKKEPVAAGIESEFTEPGDPAVVKEKSVADEIREHLKEAQRLIETLDIEGNRKLSHGKVLLDGFKMSCIPLISEGLREMGK